MLRVIFPSLVLASTLAAQDASDLILKLEGAPNPFAPAAVVFDASGVSGVYASLSRLGGTVFEEDGSGSIIFEGQPWETGETRQIVVNGTGVPTVFKSLQPADDDHPATAVFKLVSTNQEISIDVVGFQSALPEEDQGAFGWQISGSSSVAIGELEGRYELRVAAKRLVGVPVARSTKSGLTKLETTADTCSAWKAAPANYAGPVIIFSPKIRPIQVPFQVLSQPATLEVIGAVAVSSNGELIGIIGNAGLVTAAELGATPTAGVIPVSLSDRLVFLSGR